MDETIGKTTLQENDDVSESLRKLRDPIFNAWEQSVRNTIPDTKKIEDKTLKTCLKNFFDELINSLKHNRPYSSEISGVDVGSPHAPSVKIVVASSNWSSNLPWGDGFYDDEIHQREERARAQPNERAA